MENEKFETAVQIVAGDSLAAITRAEIDMQIATAHRFPRSLTIFNERAIEMVSQDIETAESCIYHRPVGKDKAGKQIIVEGESIRLAEIVAACYGNIRVVSFIVEQTERQVIARGMAHDLESNNAQSCEVVESCVDKLGKPYSERMRVITAKAALSKARRDAIFMVVPKALCKKITGTAKEVIRKDQKPLKERINLALKWIEGLRVNGKKVDKKRIYELLNVKGEEEIGIEELEILTGIKTSIKEDPDSAEDIFFGQPSTQAAPIQTMTTDLDIALADIEKANSLKRLSDISEQYPDLKADKQFSEAMTLAVGRINAIEKSEKLPFGNKK